MATLRNLCWFILVLLALAGCGTSASTPKYSATGSWEGTATGSSGSQSAEALVASDGTLYLALPSGEVFFGSVKVVDNFGQGTVGLVKPATGQTLYGGLFKFVLEAGLLTGYIQIGAERWDVTLNPTADAKGPATPEGLQGKWSLNPERTLTYLQTDPSLKITGKGGCTWNGQWSVTDSSWNLYSISLLAERCFDPTMNGNYQGLATLGSDTMGMKLHLLLAAPNASSSLLTNWYATVNQPPVANAGVDFSRKVLPGTTGVSIVLDGTASSDPNGDPLVYEWIPPAGITLTDANKATPSFVAPVGVGTYVFQLRVFDGAEWSPNDDVMVSVDTITARFVDNGDGTVTDNTTGLIWLKDASCDFFGQLKVESDGILAGAMEMAAALASPECGLNDNSAAGDWRLPSQAELRSLLDTTWTNPALSDASGLLQWSEARGPFTGVLSDLSELYWTSTGDPASYDPVYDWYLSFYYVDMFDGHSDSMSWNTPNYVWPVRDPLPAP